jgi:hypothetical protein
MSIVIVAVAGYCGAQYYFLRHLSLDVPAIKVAVLLSDGMYVHEKSYQGFIERCAEKQSAIKYEMRPFFFHGLDTINISNMAEALIESRRTSCPGPAAACPIVQV